MHIIKWVFVLFRKFPPRVLERIPLSLKFEIASPRKQHHYFRNYSGFTTRYHWMQWHCPLVIFAEISSVDVQLNSEYASGNGHGTYNVIMHISCKKSITIVILIFSQSHYCPCPKILKTWLPRFWSSDVTELTQLQRFRFFSWISRIPILIAEGVFGRVFFTLQKYVSLQLC